MRHHPSVYRQPPSFWERLIEPKVALWVLAGSLLFTLFLTPWLVPVLVTRKIESVAFNRLGASASIGDLQIGIGGDHAIRDLVIQAPGLSLHIGAIQVKSNIFGMLLGSPRLQSIVIDKGRLVGTKEGLQELLKKQLPSKSTSSTDRGEQGESKQANIEKLPEKLTVNEFQIEVGDVQTNGLVKSSIQTNVSIAGTPQTGTYAVEAHDTLLAIGADRSIAIRKVYSEVLVDLPYSLRFPLTVQFEGGATALTSKVAVAGVEGTFSVEDSSFQSLGMNIHGSFSDNVEHDEAKVWSIVGQFQRDFSRGKLKLEMESFELGRLPRVMANLPVVDSSNATIGGELELTFNQGIGQLVGALHLADLNLQHPVLAKDAVDGVSLGMELDAEVEPSQARVHFNRLALIRGEVQLVVTGEIVHPREREQRRYDLGFQIPKIPCQKVLGAIPDGFAPALKGFRLAGNYGLNGHLKVDFSDLSKTELEGLGGAFGLQRCRIRRVPKRISADRLRNEWVHRVTLRDGSLKSIDLGLGSEQFTPFEQISPMIVAGVLTTEDGGFWRHKGFLTSQFEAALRRNLEVGRVRLGASTISMQLVKNLLLTHERTLSRKLQEIFLTWYVETTLPKQRIMELYLNIVEFGPGVFGITEAAELYFGKNPWEINSLEAAYLALMLPSPVRRHVHFCKNELSAAFEVKLRRIHRFMYSREHIEEAEYLMWKDAPLVFNPERRHTQEECLQSIERFLEGDRQQGAVSGLLDVSGRESRGANIRRTRRAPNSAEGQ